MVINRKREAFIYFIEYQYLTGINTNFNCWLVATVVATVVNYLLAFITIKIRNIHHSKRSLFLFFINIGTSLKTLNSGFDILLDALGPFILPMFYLCLC